MYEVIVPVKEYVKEYLIAQFGHKAIFLPETNTYSVLLRSKEKLYNNVVLNPTIYDSKICFLSEINIGDVEENNVLKLNNYIELQIKLMVNFRLKMKVQNKKNVLLDIISECNFSEEKISTLKTYNYKLNNHAAH